MAPTARCTVVKRVHRPVNRGTPALVCIALIRSKSEVSGILRWTLPLSPHPSGQTRKKGEVSTKRVIYTKYANLIIIVI
jgi:hypothetical protein